MENLNITPYAFKKMATEMKTGVTQHLGAILIKIQSIIVNDKIKDLPEFTSSFSDLKNIKTNELLNFYENLPYFNFYSLLESKDVFKLPIDQLSSLLILSLKQQPQLIMFADDFNQKLSENNVINTKDNKPYTLEYFAFKATAECLEYWNLKEEKYKNNVLNTMLFSFPETIYYIKDFPEYQNDEKFRDKFNQISLAYHVDSVLFLNKDDVTKIIDDKFFETIRTNQTKLIEKNKSLEIQMNREFSILSLLREKMIQLPNFEYNVKNIQDIKNTYVDKEIEPIIIDEPTVNDEIEITIISRQVDLSNVVRNSNVTQKIDKPKTIVEKENNDDFTLD